MNNYDINSGKLIVINIKKSQVIQSIRRASVSVIIPVFRAELTLERALNSVKLQNWPEHLVEIILSIDDGKDYSWAKKYWPNIKICFGTALASGAGPTRNRGILLSSGQYLAFLDADDMWSAGYLDALYPVAKQHGLAYARTMIMAHDGTPLMQLGNSSSQNQSILCLDDFGSWPGSFHPFMRRDLTPFFFNQPAQDVFHAIETMAIHGNHALLVDLAAYQINLLADSVTASAGFSHRLDRSYRQMISMIMSGQTQVPKCRQFRVIRALQKRRVWNQRFMRYGQSSNSFYHFLADALA